MKLIIAGSDEVWSLERCYRKHLEALGTETLLLPVQSVFYDYYNRSPIHKVLFKTGLSGITKKIGQLFMAKVEEWQPDIVWVFKGMELEPSILEWVRQKKIILANYNPDNPFVFSGRGSGNANVTAALGLYDIHFTYDHSVRERIIREYKIPCSMLPFGFDLDPDLYDECAEQEEVMKVCFLGNPDANRASFIEQIAQKLPVDIYGHGWDKYIRHPNVTVCQPVYDKEFWKTLYKYRVQLNLMRTHNPDSHNMRSFEVPGVGAIGLFPFTADHNRFFEEGREIFMYNTIDECVQKAGMLLAMPQDQASVIRRAARERSIGSGYSYRDRAGFVLSEVKKLL